MFLLQKLQWYSEWYQIDKNVDDIIFDQSARSVCHLSMLNEPKVFDTKSKHLQNLLGNLRKSSEIFGKIRKLFENIRLPSDSILKIFGNLRKILENFRKIFKNLIIIIITLFSPSKWPSSPRVSRSSVG